MAIAWIERSAGAVAKTHSEFTVVAEKRKRRWRSEEGVRMVEALKLIEEEIINGRRRSWERCCCRAANKVWMGRGRVVEVGAGLESAHGSGGDVVGTGRLLGRVEGAEPAALLRLWVPNLGGVAAPRPAANSSVPHASASQLLVGRGCRRRRRCSLAGGVVFLLAVDFLHL